jgi:Ca2+-binding EF-hand superfamily protein
MKTSIAVAALAAAMFAAPAFADGHASFEKLDADQSGTLTLAEVQAAKPDVTAEKFAKYDTDADGALSKAEFDAWKAAKADKEYKKEMPES